MTKPELDIVIPAYNEGPNIGAVLDSFRASVRTPYRVLVVYDHDHDDTLPALRRYPEATPVKNDRQGAHAAVCTGFRTSSAPAVLVFAADDFHNARIVDRMFELFRGGCDIVAASRFMPGGCMRGCPMLKSILLRAAATTLHRFAGLPTHDPTSGFRLFSRRVLDTLPLESTLGFTYSLEYLVKAHRRRWRVAEVPAVGAERTVGRSRFRVVRWIPAYLRWVLYAFETRLFL